MITKSQRRDTMNNMNRAIVIVRNSADSARVKEIWEARTSAMHSDDPSVRREAVGCNEVGAYIEMHLDGWPDILNAGNGAHVLDCTGDPWVLYDFACPENEEWGADGQRWELPVGSDFTACLNNCPTFPYPDRSVVL